MPSLPVLIPCLRYADAPSAITFLCEAFGFERHAVYTDSSNPTIVLHAQLNLGDTMVMLGSAIAGEASERYRWRTPAEAGGITMSIYAVVDDIEAHYARAKSSGADIVSPLHDNVGYPGRSYTARDPEGHVWDFGTYNPWTT